VTASKLLGTIETLELLGTLRQHTRELVERATQLDRDFAIRSNKLRTQQNQAVAAERARWTHETEAAHAEAAARRTQLEAGFQGRRRWITKAAENARKFRLAEVESDEGRRTFETQRGLLEADRQQETDTKNNKLNHENFAPWPSS
jgi:hypothetical protein